MSDATTIRYPRLRYFNEHGSQVASDVVVMCFYMQHAHKLIAPSVVRAVSLFRERVRPYQLDWYIDHEGQFTPLDGSVWEDIYRQMQGPDESAGLRLSGGPERVGGLYVHYRGLPLPLPWPDRRHDVSALFLRLPTEYLEEQGPGRVHSLAFALAQELPFNSGYVDFASCRVGPAEDAIDLVRTRYPGVHLVQEWPEMKVNTWVDGVHWMNFLGQPVLGKLGGVAALRERLALPGISIQEMSGERVLVTLGERPEVGDMEAGQALPLHRALARLLEPHLYQRTRPLGRMSPEEMRRWERRFLD